MGLSTSAIIQSHSACWDQFALLRLVKCARFISLSGLKPLMKVMSCPGDSSTEFVQRVLGWMIGDVCWPDEIFRETTCDGHAFEGESRP